MYYLRVGIILLAFSTVVAVEPSGGTELYGARHNPWKIPPETVNTSEARLIDDV